MADEGLLAKFARALEAGGASYQGQEPQYLKRQREAKSDEFRQQQLGIQQQGLGIQQGHLDIAKEQAAQQQKVQAVQMQQVRATMLKEGIALMPAVQNLISNLPEDKRGEYVDQLTKPLSMFFGFATGDDPSTASMMTPDLIKTIVMQPGSHQKLLDTLPWLTPAQKSALSQYSSDPVKLFKAAEEMSGLAKQQALEAAQTKVATAAKGMPAAMPFKDALALLDDRGQAAVMAWLGKEAPDRVDQTLISMNVSPLGPEREKAMRDAKGFSPAQVGLSESDARMIQADPEFAKRGHDIRKWAELPATEKQFFAQRADTMQQKRRVEVSAAQGSASVTAEAQAKAGLPLYQTRKEGQHIIDLKNDSEVDYIGTKGSDLEKDSKRYKVLGAEQHKQFTAIKEMEGLFSEFERIAPQLVKQPGMNTLQELEMWAKNKMGVAGVQTDLSTLKGATLRVAKAMQGSAQSLSDMDRKTVEGMLPTAADTAQSALRRLQQTYRILGHMKGAVLGQSRVADKVKEAADFTPDFSKAQPVKRR